MKVNREPSGRRNSISEECVFEKEICLSKEDENKVPKSKTVRQCVVLRRIAPKERLIRFVMSPDGSIVPDLRCALPGRGVWVTAQRHVVDQAVTRRVFLRVFSKNVKVSPTLGKDVDTCLEKRALFALAFAYKAGVCRLGYHQVEEILNGKKAASIFAAQEASERQWNTLKALASFRYKNTEGSKIHIFQGFSTDHLSQIFGKSGVFYGALLDHIGNRGYLVCVDRLMWYRTPSSSEVEAP
jgi:predicted RNA-binding protein YlxR (DUF448 family)